MQKEQKNVGPLIGEVLGNHHVKYIGEEIKTKKY
jgi:hypothetical protein